MKQDRNVALARLCEELKRPPFHAVLRPRPIDADPDSGNVTVALKVGRMLARVDIDVTDTQGRLIAVGRGSFSTALEPPTD
jgi:hypothetical protein